MFIIVPVSQAAYMAFDQAQKAAQAAADKTGEAQHVCAAGVSATMTPTPPDVPAADPAPAAAPTPAA